MTAPPVGKEGEEEKKKRKKRGRTFRKQGLGLTGAADGSFPLHQRGALLRLDAALPKGSCLVSGEEPEAHVGLPCA